MEIDTPEAAPLLNPIPTEPIRRIKVGGIMVAPNRMIHEKGHHQDYSVLDEIEERTHHHEDLLERGMFKYMGGGGRYQWTMFMITLMLQFCLQFPLALQSFQAAGPTGLCSVNGSSTEFISCSEVEACEQIRQGLPAKLIMEDTWTKRYNMICEKRPLSRLFESIFMFVEYGTAKLVLQTADWLGRKPCVLISFIVSSVASIACHLSNSYGSKVILNAVAFSANTTYGSLFTFYLAETIDIKYYLYKYIVSGWLFIFSAGYIAFCCITFITHNPDTLSLISTLTVTISTLIPCFLIVESPLFELITKETKEFVKSVDKIRIFNGIEASEAQTLEIEREAISCKKQIESENFVKNRVMANEHSPLRKIFSSGLYLYQVVALSLIQGLYLSVYYGSNFNMEAMGPSSIAINGITAGISQMLSGLVMGIVLYKLSRKTWAILLQSIILISALLLALAGLMRKGTLVDISSSLIPTCIIIPLANAGLIPVVHYTCELFPVELRGTSSSLVNFFSILVSMGTVFISSYMDAININPLVGSCTVAVLSIPLTFFLRETV